MSFDENMPFEKVKGRSPEEASDVRKEIELALERIDPNWMNYL